MKSDVRYILMIASLVFGILAPGFLGSGLLRAEEKTVEFFSTSFLPQAVTVELGDTVHFVWRRGSHQLRSGEGPDDPAAGEIFDLPLDEGSPEFSLQIGVKHIPGFSFFDGNNPNQKGFVEVSSGEQSFRVGVVDNIFQPEILYIFANDSVLWEHEPMEAFHTVTSGLSSRPEDQPGALFDEESSDAIPIFAYSFGEAGTYPYFCRPHESLGMVGTIFVQKLFVRGDTTADEQLDISDAVLTLNYLFLGQSAPACDDAIDANDDGSVDIGDAIFTLNFLFLGAVEMPAPFPLPGPDRSPDDLNCL